MVLVKRYFAGLKRSMTKNLTKELDFSAFSSFEEASRAVLDYLQSRLGFGLWMTTRTALPHWIVLQAADQSYDVKKGDVFKWADSFCSRMVEGKGPHVALNVRDVPEYVAAEIGRQIPIGAYIGVPMQSDDGTLHGTLCAIDPSPQHIDVDGELPQIQLFARMLSSLLSAELELAAREREIVRIRENADHDGLTGLYNRRAWDQAIEREQVRFERYGSPIALFILDLDELKTTNDTQGHNQGDELLRATAECLMSVVRVSDVVARLGGDEFAVMAIECDRVTSDLLLDKLHDVFSEKGIAISIGRAIHEPGEPISDAISRADKDMYETKQRNRVKK